MTGLEIHEAWAAFRPNDSSRLPMGKSGLEQAAIIWSQWLKYCAGKQLLWDKATPLDVQNFLDQLKPRTTRPRPAASPVTTKRYWRVVNDIYAHAAPKRSSLPIRAFSMTSCRLSAKSLWHSIR